VCPVWVPCVAFPSGGGSPVGSYPLCGFPVWVPSVGPLCWSPLCVGPLCGYPVWVPCWHCWGPSASARPAAFHVASTRVMSPARSHAPALHAHRTHRRENTSGPDTGKRIVNCEFEKKKLCTHGVISTSMKDLQKRKRKRSFSYCVRV